MPSLVHDKESINIDCNFYYEIPKMKMNRAKIYLCTMATGK